MLFNIVPFFTDTGTAEKHDRAFDVNLVLYIVLFTLLNTMHVVQQVDVLLLSSLSSSKKMQSLLNHQELAL